MADIDHSTQFKEDTMPVADVDDYESVFALADSEKPKQVDPQELPQEEADPIPAPAPADGAVPIKYSKTLTKARSSLNKMKEKLSKHRMRLEKLKSNISMLFQ
eukprot:CAMPEP_0117433986 /NCGR_PEP_ID=MMETSP0758-20121206/13280_1 /TAXON_ID=63605 /ORGANISM="Percolomonas cosmopolitus, Strain AE-1 (ATCC 50343)" /LENGTH=102 /DNA_ID=CAMNT_0005225063 /DNA_START=777 /DNA_END=1085 /DNA_ORIENTATION=+